MPNIVFNVDLMYRVHLLDDDMARLPIIKEMLNKYLRESVPVYTLLQIQDLGVVTVEPILDGKGATAILEDFISRLKR